MRRALLPFCPMTLLTAVLFFGQPAARAQSGQEVVERLKTRYERVDALRAAFRQTLITPDGREGDTFSGTLILRGDQFRVEVPGQTIVTDGRVTWIYNAAENQVLINDYVKDETTFSLNDFLFNFEDRYEIISTGRALLNGKEHRTVRLRPRDPASYFREIMVVMRESDDLITRIEVVDVNETKLVFDLREIELDPPLAPDTFAFTPPPGAEVVDLRSD
ncbi:outer-membrane lipoprotein carrier protein LolA [Rhodocaloribacter litoris]|uniref:LolA family protein n=1 Tax=Rhodocaloribacter litoris TaxID=2558931 RepID=UPI001422FBF5|nr:outer membrane lipoprotein carrier protein LolA [Rhodocaloribacter litoris]QXD14957.1 outer-membrane lipoprotein carrier protein LolA [Rhodocaloribacter litoris]